MNPVLVLTLYRRPQYTRQVLLALSACFGFEELPLFVSCDVSSEHAAACEAVLFEVHRWAERASPRGLYVARHDPRRGIDENKLWAVPAALEWAQAQGVILLEDDTLPAPDALNFFTTLLARTADDPEVLSIGGYNRYPANGAGPEDALASEAARAQPYGTQRFPGFNPWGWAMTRARWENLFGQDAARYRAEVGDEVNGRFDWWLSAQARREGLVSVRPLLARVQSIGGENAEHTPGPQWHSDHELNRWGAWDLDLTDRGLRTWDAGVAQ